MKRKYLLPRWIYVDVDGTLSDKVIQWCRGKKDKGFIFVLWSSQGVKHAQKAADAYNCNDVFDYILSKPGYIIDDQGWGWIKYTRRIRQLIK